MYSGESSMIAGSSLRSASGSIFCSSLLMSRTMRDSSSSETSARTAKPVRTCPAPYSSEPIDHASVSIWNSEGLNAGVRALPRLQLVQAARELRRQRALVHAELLQDARRNRDSVASSSFIRKCSISTL